jgi:hypothetical protein
MFIPLLPFSALPFIGPAQFTAKRCAPKAVWTRFRTLSIEPLTAISV